jgi:hypothetical protein
MRKITIVEFYKELSNILHKSRDSKNMRKEFDELMESAKFSNLNVSVDPSILNINNLKSYDDEFSYEEETYTTDDDDGYSY